MDLTQLVVTVVGLTLVIGILLFFFGPRKPCRRTQLPRARRRSIFWFRAATRRLSSRPNGASRCDFGSTARKQRRVPTSSSFLTSVSVRDLAAFQTTIVEFVPNRNGEFTFVCGMNMLRGTLVVTD